jgi:catechol 2,3-dioxygenase-like lactoylglutathione lyase family enzyme
MKTRAPAPSSLSDTAFGIPLLGNPTQLGFVGRDARAMAATLGALFGLREWRFETWPPRPLRPDWECWYRGAPTQWEAVLGFAYFGALEVEAIEVPAGTCAYTEHLARVGEGLHHLQYRVEDMEAVEAHFVEQGIAPIMGASGRKPGTRWLLFDTYRQVGFYTEVLAIPRPRDSAHPSGAPAGVLSARESS